MENEERVTLKELESAANSYALVLVENQFQKLELSEDSKASLTERWKYWKNQASEYAESIGTRAFL